MLVNQEPKEVTSHVEFVEYTGRWPNLCRGILTLKIDGEIQKFGNAYPSKESLHPRFWNSGGHYSIEPLSNGEWIIDASKLPEEFRKYAAEIDNVFNNNVEFGCCGGCR